MQSGKIHFYNTKTQMRTCMDPRGTQLCRSPEPPSPSDRHMISLDLELNLTTSESPIRKTEDQNVSKLIERNDTSISTTSMAYNNLSNSMESGKKKKSTSTSWPSWLAFETGDQQEMVATVCMRCHMLVMLCRSSPLCPNCKFMHSAEKSPAQTSIFRSSCGYLRPQ